MNIELKSSTDYTCMYIHQAIRTIMIISLIQVFMATSIEKLSINL